MQSNFQYLNPHIFRIRDRWNWSHWQAIMSINAWNERVLIWIDIFLFQSQPDQLWLCPHQWNYGEALRFLTRLSGMKWISSQSNHYWYVIIYQIFLLCSHHPETRSFPSIEKYLLSIAVIFFITIFKLVKSRANCSKSKKDS